jgi:hypothetical protein
VNALLRSLLVVLALGAMLAVIGTPAFATPSLTTSTSTRAGRPDNAAVSPFLTPIGNTSSSSITATSGLSQFAFGGASMTCTSVTSGYVPLTHTRVLITRLDYVTCLARGLGGLARVTTSASSAAPWNIHVTAYDVPSGSWGGTINIPAGGRAEIELTASNCVLVVQPQSVDLVGDNATRALEVADESIAFTRTGSATCPPSGLMSLLGAYAMRADTRSDEERRALRVTLTS